MSTLSDKEAKTKSGLALLDVLDALPFYVMLIDAEHHIIMANKAVRQQLGVTPERIIGGYCPEAIHGLKDPYPGCPVEEAAKTGNAVEREFYDSDSGRWVKSAAYPTGQKTPEGRMIYFHMIYDITERKQAEKKIKELNKNLELKVRERTAEVEEQKEKLTAANEELTAMNEELTATQDELNEVNINLEKKVEEKTKQWRLSETVSTSLGRVIEESLNEIFVFDSKTLKFINVNKGARENLGYTLEELQNLTPLDIKPEFTQEQFKKLIQPLLTGKQNSLVFTTIHKRKDSSTYDVEVHLQLSTFGNQRAFIAVILDITERKQAEEKLHEKIKELETWQRLTAGREVRMVELKAEIEELKTRLKKYETF